MIEQFSLGVDPDASSNGAGGQGLYVLWYSGEPPYKVSERRKVAPEAARYDYSTERVPQAYIQKDGLYDVPNSERGVTRYYRPHDQHISYTSYTGQPFQPICRDRREMCEIGASFDSLLSVKSVPDDSDGCVEDKVTGEMQCPGHLSYGKFEGASGEWIKKDTPGCTEVVDGVFEEPVEMYSPGSVLYKQAVQSQKEREAVQMQSMLNAIDSQNKNQELEAAQMQAAINNAIAGAGTAGTASEDDDETYQGQYQSPMDEDDCDSSSVVPNREMSKRNRKYCRSYRARKRGNRFGRFLLVCLGLFVVFYLMASGACGSDC